MGKCTVFMISKETLKYYFNLGTEPHPGKATPKIT